MYLVFLLYALFASVFTLSKTALEYTQPLFFIGTRMIAAGILMLGYLFIFQKDSLKIRKEDLWKVGKLGLVNIYLTNMFEFWGLQYLTSFKTCLIYSLSPFISALFSYFLFKEVMTPKKWLGFAIGFAGLLPVLISQSAAEEQSGHLLFLSSAEIAVMLAAVCSVYGWVLLRQAVKENGLSPLFANGMSMLMGGSFALLHSFFAEDWTPFPVTQLVGFMECAVLLIIVSNLVCYNLYGYLLKRYTATFMSFAGFTTPLWTAFFGWLTLGEVVTLPFYVSAAVVFVALVIFYQEELQQGYFASLSPSS